MIRDIQLVIFDCDGVMFDTAEVNRAYYNRILRHFNRPDLTTEQFAYAHMHTSDEAIAHLFPEPDIYQAAQAFRKEMGYAGFIPHMKPEPALRPLLSWLRPQYKTAIVTNRTDTMNRVLTTFELDRDFDLVVTAFDVARPKPHPEGLYKAMDAFRLGPCQALYIGDSEVDAHAAASAGVAFAAYQNRALDAAFHIDGLGEVRTILEAKAG